MNPGLVFSQVLKTPRYSPLFHLRAFTPVTKSHASTMTTGKHDRSQSQEDVLRHPSTKRAKEIDEHAPMEQLKELLKKQKTDHAPRNVLHWFRSKDIRMQDNHALHKASEKAKEGKGYLITMYLMSAEDMKWHGTSPVRTDFILESLRLLKGDLTERHIPLAFVEAEHRGDKIDRVLEFVKEHDISHIYGNIEYEVDELRRDIKLCKQVPEEDGLSFEALHDQTVVTPGDLKTGGGGPHKVFTPYHKDWVAIIAEDADLLEPYNEPEANDKKATQDLKKLFDSKLPELPEDKSFASKDEKSRLRKLWPAGHEAGMKRLGDFLNKKVADYAQHRSEPARDISSRLSPYFAAGVIGLRETLTEASKANGSAAFTSSNDPGIAAWVRELVFREFYRHTLVGTPHDSMNLPHNLKFDFVQWEDDEEGWRKWCEGTTGVPFVDAGMRQLNHEAYMHNRLRMNVSSYLRTNLLIDYRKGERYFAEHLVDWDLANNTQGWEPSYTVFNPVVQAEKCDKNGDYIRKWVPELKDVEGKAVFAPHERLSKAEFEKLGYPKPHVDFKESKDRALSRYKQDLAEADP